MNYAHCFIVGFGLTEMSPLTHANPSENYRYDSSGFAVPNTEYKVGMSATTVVRCLLAAIVARCLLAATVARCLLSPAYILATVHLGS